MLFPPLRLQKASGPGDQAAAAGDAVGSAAAQAGQRAAGGTTWPDRRPRPAVSIRYAPILDLRTGWDGGEQRADWLGAISEAGFHPVLGGRAPRRVAAAPFFPAFPPLALAAIAPRDRGCWRACRPPGGEARGIEHRRHPMARSAGVVAAQSGEWPEAVPPGSWRTDDVS